MINVRCAERTWDGPRNLHVVRNLRNFPGPDRQVRVGQVDGGMSFAQFRVAGGTMLRAGREPGRGALGA